MNPKIKGNRLYCAKHRDWFFSVKYAKTGVFPTTCPICKQPKYDTDRVREFWKGKVWRDEENGKK